MNTLQDHGFYILISYGVSALLVAGEIALLWRRRRALQGQDQIQPSATQDRA